MDGIESLEKDHDRIRSLFVEVEGTVDPHELQDSFGKLGNLLTIHAEAEEQVLYPEARNCERTAELIDQPTFRTSICNFLDYTKLEG